TTCPLEHPVPVIYRHIPNSDALSINVTRNSGVRDLPLGEKSVNQLLFATMPMAAKGCPKETVFRLTEKYALRMGCSGGVESSGCYLGTINDYWKEALPLFAAVIKDPSLDAKDVDLVREQSIAATKSQMQDPSTLSNDVVNEIF